MIKIDLKELAEFLVKAKKKAWAGNGKEVKPQRPGFKELSVKEGNWEYRDSYRGFYSAPGQEIVRLKGEPVWHMAYSGGMKPEYYGNLRLAKEVFAFLKKALKKVDEDEPFRGPSRFESEYDELIYHNYPKGDITNFSGCETIKNSRVQFDCTYFEQDYIGGLIVPKNWKDLVIVGE
jgi:hypothetical protein